MADSRLEQWYRYLESQFESESQSQSDKGVRSEAYDTPTPSADAPEAKHTSTPTLDVAPSASHPVSKPLEANFASLTLSAPPTLQHPKTESAPSPSIETETPRENTSPEDDIATRISMRVPHIFEFLPMLRPEGETIPHAALIRTEIEPPSSDGPRLRKRKRRPKVDPQTLVPPDKEEVWAKLPRYLRYLAEWTDDSVTRKYYPARIRESREELIARLTDPVLTLEETARLLGVCPATIRRYTDRGWLRHFRTEGNQRRFRLSDIVAFLEEQAQRRPMGNRNASKSAQEDLTEEP